MNYKEALESLYSKLPIYQHSGEKAYKKDLTNTLALLRVINNPHNNFKSIHIAGTNGKGTSAHGLAAILQAAGYKTGLYTSPHLKKFTERIKVDGAEVSEDFIVEFMIRIQPHIISIQPSFFEVTVVMAFEYFSRHKVDIAVIETGLGGRLDSTNVITPEVSLITNIGLDHTDLLGDTKEKIAFEKAGIIKSNVPIVIGSNQKEVMHVFEKVSQMKDAPLTVAKKQAESYHLPKFYPNYAKKNIPGILSVINLLNNKGFSITQNHIAKGLLNVNKSTGLKGRFQIIQRKPLTIADVSHNAEGLKELMKQVNEMSSRKLYIIFGSVKGKDLASIFKVLPKNATYYWSESTVQRSMKASDLEITAQQTGLKGSVCPNVNDALLLATNAAKEHDIILITGSTYLIADLKYGF